MILVTQVRHIDFLDAEIQRIDRKAEERLSPFEEELELLGTISGAGRRSAERIVAKIGFDMF